MNAITEYIKHLIKDSKMHQQTTKSIFLMRENTCVNSTYKLHVCTLCSGRDAAETQTTLMPPEEALKVQAFCSKLSMIDSSQA